MALVLNDRVKETSVTTGTGTLTLDGAVQGFETFSSAIGNSNTTFYAIELPGTTEFEVGRGTVSAGQLARTQVISSSNSDSPVDFSAGTKIVFCTLPASKFVPGKFEGSNFANSILIGHSDSGSLNNAQGNVGVGITALDALVTADNNVAVGFGALSANASGNSNTALGQDSLAVNNSGAENTAVGSRSSYLLANGTGNTTIGFKAGEQMNNADADYNILIGHQAGDNITEGAGNVIIGSVDAAAADGDRTLKIAGYDGSSTTTWISGDSAGALTFADKVVLAANKTIEFGDSGETISGDGTDLTIASSRHIKFDATNDITLDAGAGGLKFDDDGVTIGLLFNASGDLTFKIVQQDKDLNIKGNDGGSEITALTLDMSEAGAATFNDKVILGANKSIEFGDSGENISGDGTNLLINSGGYTELTSTGNILLNGASVAIKDGGTNILQIDRVSNAVTLTSRVTDDDIKFRGNDGSLTALTLDMSDAGTATFNNKIILGANKVIEFGDSGETISGDGTDLTIASSNDATIDVTGQINLDADDNGLVTINDGGTQIGSFFKTASTFSIKSDVQDKRLEIKGNDGGSEVVALAFHMANAGQANFNDKIILNANKVIEFGDAGETISGDGTAITVASSEDITLDAASEINLDAGSDSIRIKDDGTEYGRIHRVSGGGLIIKSQESDKDIQFQGVDGGSGITPMMIDMSEGGRVGIFGSGTTVPTAQLHVATDAGGVKLQVTGSSSSVTPGNDADEIFVDNAGNAGVTIGSGTSSKGSIHFGDSGDNDIGMIEYDHSSNSLAFTTNAAERIRVDSSGRVGIGTNSPSRDVHVKKTTSGSPVRLEVNNESNTGSSHGVISIYSGGTSGGDPYLHFKVNNGEQYSIGIDNDQSDALVFSNNFGVGSNNLLSIATDGSATFTGTVTANGEVLSAGVSAGFAVAMAIAL